MPKGKEGFDRGDPNINRAGRPLGSLNKKKIRWYNLQELGEWAEDVLKDMKPQDRIDYIKHKEKLLFEKLSQVPATSQESVDRVNDAQSELDKAESNESKPGSDPIRMGTGETKIQA